MVVAANCGRAERNIFTGGRQTMTKMIVIYNDDNDVESGDGRSVHLLLMMMAGDCGCTKRNVSRAYIGLNTSKTSH